MLMFIFFLILRQFPHHFQIPKFSNSHISTFSYPNLYVYINSQADNNVPLLDVTLDKRPLDTGLSRTKVVTST